MDQSTPPSFGPASYQPIPAYPSLPAPPPARSNWWARKQFLIPAAIVLVVLAITSGALLAMTTFDIAKSVGTHSVGTSTTHKPLSANDFTKEQDDAFYAGLQRSIPSLASTVPFTILTETGHTFAYGLSSGGLTEEQAIAIFEEHMTNFDADDARSFVQTAKDAYLS